MANGQFLCCFLDVLVLPRWPRWLFGAKEDWAMKQETIKYNKSVKWSSFQRQTLENKLNPAPQNTDLLVFVRVVKRGHATRKNSMYPFSSIHCILQRNRRWQAFPIAWPFTTDYTSQDGVKNWGKYSSICIWCRLHLLLQTPFLIQQIRVNGCAAYHQNHL